MGIVCGRHDDAADARDREIEKAPAKDAKPEGNAKPAPEPQVGAVWGYSDGSSSPKLPPASWVAWRETWPAGSFAIATPPHYIPERAGPFVHMEKVAPQVQLAGRFLFSSTCVPPRVVDAADPLAVEVDDAGADDDEQHKHGDDDDLLAVPTMNADSSLFCRAYFPHSLSAMCVGWVRLNMAEELVVDGFTYDQQGSAGAEVEQAIIAGVPLDIADKRKVLLFPKLIRSVGLQLSVNGNDDALSVTSLVIDSSGAAATESVHASPLDDSFVTTSLVDPKTDASVLSTRSENSIGFSFLDVKGNLTPLGAEWRKLVLGLPEGEHAVRMTLKMNYDGRDMFAVQSRGATQRVVGTYKAANLPASITSSVLAEGRIKLRVTSAAKQHLKNVGPKLLSLGVPHDHLEIHPTRCTS